MVKAIIRMERWTCGSIASTRITFVGSMVLSCLNKQRFPENNNLSEKSKRKRIMVEGIRKGDYNISHFRAMDCI